MNLADCGAMLLLQAGSVEIEEAVRWLRSPPAWLVALVLLPAIGAFVAFFYRRERPVGSPHWRWVLGTLRFLTCAAVLFMLFEPVRRTTTYETRDSTLLIMVDDSLSMDITDRYGDRSIPVAIGQLLGLSPERVEELSRYELVRRLLGEVPEKLIEPLRRKVKLVVVTFARSVQEIARLERKGSDRGAVAETGEGEGAAGVELPPYDKVRGDLRVQETRIGECLRDAVAGALGSRFGEDAERLVGVLCFTDGRENAGSVPALRVARRLGERGIPIYTVGVGNPEKPKDIRLVNVDANEVVLVDDQVSFDAVIEAEGFEEAGAGERIRVDLKIDSGIVDTRYVELPRSGERAGVRLTFRPRKPGEYTTTVEVETLPGEIFENNNVLTRPLRVLDQKIKLLYIEGLPRWEYRYLKNAFIRDPTVEAQVYLVSADPGFVQESSPGLPPLTAIPSRREELFGYHVIFIGDVDPKDIGEERMALLKEFVLEGGGVVFIAGPHANPHRYVHTDLYPLLPVEVAGEDRFAAFERGPFTSEFHVKLTPVGREHPVMRLDNDPDRNAELWEGTGPDGGLPGFYWYAEVEREKAGAVVLARHPTRVHPIHRKGLVIFAFMNYGKGRTFYSGVDNTWRWRRGVDNLYLYRFWGQVIRFVASGRLLGKTPRFRIATDKATYNIGETVKIEAHVYDANMKPSGEPSVTVFHLGPGNEGGEPEQLQLSLNRVKGAGVYEGTLPADRRGRHELWLGSESERLAFAGYTVEVPALESREPRLDVELLENVAKVSQGAYVDFHRAGEIAAKVKAVRQAREGIVEDDALWDEWWVIVLLVGMLSAEWILRKGVRLL